MQKKIDMNFFLNLVIEAGEVSKKYFGRSEKQGIKYKKDLSEITIVDKEINDLFNTRLSLHYSNIPIISEENSIIKNKQALYGDRYFVIDPLDGTRAYINNSDEHAINFSYIESNKLSLSIIYVPQKKIIYFCDKSSLKKGNIFKKTIINVDKVEYNSNDISMPIRVLLTERLKEQEIIYKMLNEQGIKYNGKHVSSSLKFCYMAENYCDIYIRMANIKFWDVIAGFHICMVSGLTIYNYNNTFMKDCKIQEDFKSSLIRNNFSVDKFYIKHKDLKYKNIL
tara:strand:- start:320 stop:1162 length:843 start_codon:yes stop_codon:yes gene_type:complete